MMTENLVTVFRQGASELDCVQKVHELEDVDIGICVLYFKFTV